MQDKGEEGGQVGEDAGQDDRIPCLVVHYSMKQLHALINRQLLVSWISRKRTEHGVNMCFTSQTASDKRINVNYSKIQTIFTTQICIQPCSMKESRKLHDCVLNRRAIPPSPGL